MQELAYFEYFDEKVVLRSNDTGTAFEVEADWSSQGKTHNLIADGLRHREAVVKYADLVNMSLSRLTLSSFYAKLGQTPPVGEGKYGLST